MKSALLLLLMCLATLSFAQKLKVEYVKKTDVILVNGEKWATIKTTKGNGDYSKIITLKDLKGKDIAFAKLANGLKFYEIEFTQSKRVVYKDYARLNTTRDFAMFLIDNEALTKDGYSSAGEDKMVSFFSKMPNDDDIFARRYNVASAGGTAA